MSIVPLPKSRPRSIASSSVDAVRAEIDEIDDQVLDLIERRQRLAGQIGALKPLSPLKLHPAREAQVISRLARAASPAVATVVEPVWRELIGASLSAQQQLSVAVWDAGHPEISRLARARFGSCAGYQDAASAEAALAAASEGSTVAVLSLRSDSAWWADLLNMPELWIFDSLGGRGPLDPIALAVGRLDPEVLARGVAYRVSRGGDSNPRAAPERVLQVDHGRRLSAVRQKAGEPICREQGFVGASSI